MYKRNNNERNSNNYRSDNEKKYSSGERSFSSPRPRIRKDEDSPRRFEKNERGTEGRSSSEEKRPFKRFDNDRPYSRPFKRNDDERSGRSYNPDFKSSDRTFRRDDDKRERPAYRQEGDRPRRPRTSESRYGNDSQNTNFQQRSGDERIRLNKLIASSGICSRREADQMISAGLISVNGNIVSELGTKVLPSDDIRYNGERLRQERLVYIVMNKPKDYVTTTKDPYAKRTVMELMEGACKERVFPVGRLDRNTTGVLLITNDGELAKKLTHPSHNKKKIYHVHLDKSLKGQDIETIIKGIELEDGFIKADEINFVDPEDKKQIGVEIHSGRNRIVRRIFEQLGYKVMKLDRVYFAGLTKKGLQRGQWRFLTNQEIGMLKMGSYQ